LDCLARMHSPRGWKLVRLNVCGAYCFGTPNPRAIGRSGPRYSLQTHFTLKANQGTNRMSPSSLLSLRRAVSLLSYLPKPPLPATASTSAGVRSLSSTPEKPQNDSAALKQSSQPSDDSVNPMAKDHISSMEYERSKKGSNDSTGMRKGLFLEPHFSSVSDSSTLPFSGQAGNFARRGRGVQISQGKTCQRSLEPTRYPPGRRRRIQISRQTLSSSAPPPSPPQDGRRD